MADFDADNEYVWLGGTTTNALQLPQPGNTGYTTASTAAIILVTRPGEETLDKGFLVDHLTHPTDGEISIIGVRALIAFDKDAFGVLQPAGTETVFFHIDAPYGISAGIEVQFKLFADQTEPILCNIQQEHLFRSPDNSILLTGTLCTHDGHTYAFKIEDKLSSVSNSFKTHFVTGISPFGISASSNYLLWGTYAIDSVTSEPTIYFMLLTNDSTMSPATPTCLYEYVHDSGKTDGSVFTPKMALINDAAQ